MKMTNMTLTFDAAAALGQGKRGQRAGSGPGLHEERRLT